jgi:hypothetical protein
VGSVRPGRPTAAMSERRVLLALLLLALAVAYYIWGRPGAKPQEGSESPEKAEAEERAKANPFPAPAPQP